MTIRNIYDAQLLVGFLFSGSEKVKEVLKEKSGPGLNCYNYEMFKKLLDNDMTSEQELVFRSHLTRCEWCRLLFDYSERIKAEVHFSSLVNIEATEYYVKHKILPELINNRFPLAKKIRMAWNIL